MPKLTNPNPTRSQPTPRSKPPRRERELAWHGQGLIVAGVDEVGRGAWAGPLVSAAVVLTSDCQLADVRDSKLMTPAARERSAELIRKQSAGVGIGVVEIAELNQRGLAWSLREAGLRALRKLPQEPGKILLDGHHDYFAGQRECETIVGGDAIELCIAAASIVAKVHRDGLMVELHEAYPAYGFAAHKGYGTPRHRAALKAHGPCDLHRSQWKPINELLQQQLL